MDIEKVKSEIARQLDPVLEPGILYYYSVLNIVNATSGGYLFQFVDGKKDHAICSGQNEILSEIVLDDYKNAMYVLTRSFPVDTKIRYTFKKGTPMMIELYTPTMLIEEMEQEIAEPGFLKVEEWIDFIDPEKVEFVVESKRTRDNHSVIESGRSIVATDIKNLFNILNRSLKKIHILYEHGTLKVSSVPAFPKWNIPLYVEPDAYEVLDEGNLSAIYAFLESLNEKKIAMALKVLDSNPEFKLKAESRYLNLVRVRLNDSTAELDRLSQPNVINKTNVSTMLGNYLQEDFISFSYMQDTETKFIVDYLGSMVRNSFTRESYYDQVVEFDSEKALLECYSLHAESIKNWIKCECELYSDGWFGKINNKLFNLRLRRMMFEKTKFVGANESSALDEFIFFINLNHKGRIYIDVCQSNLPAFSPMFWLLPAVPQTNWIDVKPVFPKSILTFERKTEYRLGDGAKWKTLSSLKV